MQVPAGRPPRGRWRPPPRRAAPPGSPRSARRRRRAAVDVHRADALHREQRLRAAPAAGAVTCSVTRLVCSTARCSPAGESMASSRPWLMMATRRQISVASARMCVLSSTAWSSPKARMTSRVSWIWPGSSPAVGSSSSSTSGVAEQRLGQPQALAVALGELVDLVTEHRLQMAGRRDPLELGADGGARHALHLGHEAQVRRDVERVVEGRALGQVADAPRRLDVLRWPCRSRPPVTRPDVAAVKPAIMRIVVVLPAPLGPRKPTISPGSTVKERSWMTVRRAVALGDRLERDAPVRESSCRDRRRPPGAPGGLRTPSGDGAATYTTCRRPPCTGPDRGRRRDPRSRGRGSSSAG